MCAERGNICFELILIIFPTTSPIFSSIKLAINLLLESSNLLSKHSLFDQITVDTVAKNMTQSHTSSDGKNKQNIDYLKIGTKFMSDLARVKNFTLPTISNNELRNQMKKMMFYGCEI